MVAIVAAMAVAAGCARHEAGRPSEPAVIGGDPAAGAAAIGAYGCGSCHRIPGIDGAASLVGPPLDAWSRRSFVAGTLTNNSENLVAFLVDPQGVRPGSAMPDLGLDEATARAIAVYLFGLR